MIIELRSKDVTILSAIISDYLESLAVENSVIKSCELLLARLGHYNLVEEFHKNNPHPSLENLLTGGVKSSAAKRDIKAQHRFHNRLEIIDAAFRLAHQKRGTKILKLSEI